MTRPVALITGVGPGTGTALVERFVEGGYRVAMMARSADRLQELEARYEHAHAVPCDVADSDALEAGVDRVEQGLGAVSVLVHNAVRGVRGDFQTVDPTLLELAFRINVQALLLLARRVAPAMIEAGQGAIIATGNTAAYRGKDFFAGFAPTKAAQRILLESIARSAGPKGVHAAYVAIDAVIDLEWTRKRWPDEPDEFFCKPADIAAEVFHIAHQPKSAWTFDTVIRPFGETW
ncbi:MAG: SDR family NAD(P)-dependent oxidoreductase [Pseudomonadota bacterium]